MVYTDTLSVKFQTLFPRVELKKPRKGRRALFFSRVEIKAIPRKEIAKGSAVAVAIVSCFTLLVPDQLYGYGCTERS